MALGRVLSLRLRATATLCALLVGLAAALPAASQARQDTRTLKLHFTHTGERGAFTYRRNGQYDRKELERINHILRDWRRGEPTRMDPALLDLLWEIHRRTGSNEHIHVISAYRSPATNDALRRRSSGVAQNSQHTRGKALDFFIPGVPLPKLRSIALTVQGGGVGYYPGSGSPFVHVDTGSVRHWPRMTRQQLVSLFPDGETLHLPSDGKPLPGYERAVARQKSGGSISVASAATSSRSGGSDGQQANVSAWLQNVFSRGSGEDGPARPRPQAAPQPTAVARAADAPQPQAPQAAPEAPLAAPVPRPAAAVEVALASEEPDGEAAVPLPRAVPAKTRALLMAARDRARLVQLASAADASDEAAGADPSPSPAASPQARPAAPVVVAALGDRQGREEVDPVSADAALAGLYAAAGGGNPEPGAARLMTAAAVQPEPAARPAAVEADAPKPGELAVTLLGLTAMPGLWPSAAEGGGAGTALDAANALGGRSGDGGHAARSEPKVELAYATPNGAAGDAAEAPSRGSEPPAPQAKRDAVPAAAPLQLVAVRLDRPLLRRLMSQETTRTGTFGILARPQPRSDFYQVPADGDDTLALAHLGQPRTDRFQPR